MQCLIHAMRIIAQAKALLHSAQWNQFLFFFKKKLYWMTTGLEINFELLWEFRGLLLQQQQSESHVS